MTTSEYLLLYVFLFLFSAISSYMGACCYFNLELRLMDIWDVILMSDGGGGGTFRLFFCALFG